MFHVSLVAGYLSPVTIAKSHSLLLAYSPIMHSRPVQKDTKPDKKKTQKNTVKFQKINVDSQLAIAT